MKMTKEDWYHHVGQKVLIATGEGSTKEVILTGVAHDSLFCLLADNSVVKVKESTVIPILSPLDSINTEDLDTFIDQTDKFIESIKLSIVRGKLIYQAKFEESYGGLTFATIEQIRLLKSMGYDLDGWLECGKAITI